MIDSVDLACKTRHVTFRDLRSADRRERLPYARAGLSRSACARRRTRGGPQGGGPPPVPSPVVPVAPAAASVRTPDVTVSVRRSRRSPHPPRQRPHRPLRFSPPAPAAAHRAQGRPRPPPPRPGPRSGSGSGWGHAAVAPERVPPSAGVSPGPLADATPGRIDGRGPGTSRRHRAEPEIVAIRGASLRRDGRHHVHRDAMLSVKASVPSASHRTPALRPRGRPEPGTVSEHSEPWVIPP